jgi:hypothetical protein
VKDRPEELARLDLLFEAVRIAHETTFGLHRRLVALAVDDDDSQRLLGESARIALDDLRALTAEARRLAARWDEQSLLAREEADRTLLTVRAELDRIEPDLRRLRARQQEIARELRSRLTDARER